MVCCHSISPGRSYLWLATMQPLNADTLSDPHCWFQRQRQPNLPRSNSSNVDSCILIGPFGGLLAKVYSNRGEHTNARVNTNDPRVDSLSMMHEYDDTISAMPALFSIQYERYVLFRLPVLMKTVSPERLRRADICISSYEIRSLSTRG